jgi:hypothetical protein
MYAVIGTRDAKLSCPTLVETAVETCHDLFYSVEDAEEYIDEQTGKSVTDDQCPLRVIEVVGLDDEMHRAG